MTISDHWLEYDHIGSLLRMLKGMFMTCGARAPSNQLAGWGTARHNRGAGHESCINPNNLRRRQVCGSNLFFASCEVCW